MFCLQEVQVSLLVAVAMKRAASYWLAALFVLLFHCSDLGEVTMHSFFGFIWFGMLGLGVP
jgi:hypothetical protein